MPAKNLQELIELARKERALLRVLGHRHHDAPLDGAHQDGGQGRHHARALPAGAGGGRRGRRPHADLQHLDAAGGVAREGAAACARIAVTSAQRSPALPDVPTVNEQGFSGFDDLTWTAFFAPAGMPQDLVNRLNSEINRALSSPDVAERLAQLGLDWKANTSGEFAAFLRDEVQKWAQAVKESGAKAD